MHCHDAENQNQRFVSGIQHFLFYVDASEFKGATRLEAEHWLFVFFQGNVCRGESRGGYVYPQTAAINEGVGIKAHF